MHGKLSRSAGSSARDGSRWAWDMARLPKKLLVKLSPSFARNQLTGVASTLKLVDQALTKTRGAAGAIVELCPAKGHVTAAGVGNISMPLLNNGESKSFGCDNGTLGTGVPKINEFTQPWMDGSRPGDAFRWCKDSLDS